MMSGMALAERTSATLTGRSALELAAAAADAADAAPPPPAERPPLHGVPCTIKESFAVAGLPNAAGLVSRRDVRAEADAPTVARLRAAGGIPPGVTKTSPACMWVEFDNQ